MYRVFHKEKYPELTLMQLKLYLQNRDIGPSQVLVINVNG
jgi:hypothetical protein